MPMEVIGHDGASEEGVPFHRNRSEVPGRIAQFGRPRKRRPYGDRDVSARSDPRRVGRATITRVTIADQPIARRWQTDRRWPCPSAFRGAPRRRRFVRADDPVEAAQRDGGGSPSGILFALDGAAASRRAASRTSSSVHDSGFGTTAVDAAAWLRAACHAPRCRLSTHVASDDIETSPRPGRRARSSAPRTRSLRQT